MPRGGGGRRGGAGGRARGMARRMAAHMAMRAMRRRRRRRRRMLLVGGLIAFGAYKMSKRNADRVEEHTGKKAEELTDEQLEQAMDQLGIEKQELTDEEWAEVEKADAQQDYIEELERLDDLRKKGIITDEEFAAKKKQLLDI